MLLPCQFVHQLADLVGQMHWCRFVFSRQGSLQDLSGSQPFALRHGGLQLLQGFRIGIDVALLELDKPVGLLHQFLKFFKGDKFLAQRDFPIEGKEVCQAEEAFVRTGFPLDGQRCLGTDELSQ